MSRLKELIEYAKQSSSTDNINQLVLGACSVVSDSLQPHGLYVAHQPPLSMKIFRQEHWSGLPFPTPGDLLHLGIEPASPAFAGGFFTTEPPGKPQLVITAV